MKECRCFQDKWANCSIGIYSGSYKINEYGCLVIHVPFGNYLKPSNLPNVLNNCGIKYRIKQEDERSWFR